MIQLSQIAEIRMGYPFRSRLEHDPAGDIAVIQMKDIDESNLLHVEETVRLTLPNVKRHHLVQEGDVLFRSRGRTNSAALVVGKVAPAVLAAPMLLIRPKGVLPAYLHWFINLPMTQTLLGGRAEGTSVRMVGKAALEALPVPLPPPPKQMGVVELAALAAQEQHLMSQIAAKRRTLIDEMLMRYAQETRRGPRSDASGEATDKNEIEE